MSAEIVGWNDGILTARISGMLLPSELVALHKAIAPRLREHGQARMLILAEGFEGWQAGEGWSDMSFMENDPFIEKMAIIGDRRWEELASAFTAKGMRPFPIEYFSPGEAELARAWLDA
jgi:hypothetical protein